MNQAPSGLGPYGLRSLTQEYGPSARVCLLTDNRPTAVAPLDLSLRACLAIPICALTRSADLSRRGLSDLHFCLGKSCLVLCPLHERPCHVVRAPRLNYTHTHMNPRADDNLAVYHKNLCVVKPHAPTLRFCAREVTIILQCTLTSHILYATTF